MAKSLVARDINKYRSLNSLFESAVATLRWSWVDGNGPFITNGVLRENFISSSDTESDSVTATMFNLDNLNADRPEAYQGAAWRRGHS